jgi:hypothetical protein
MHARLGAWTCYRRDKKEDALSLVDVRRRVYACERSEHGVGHGSVICTYPPCMTQCLGHDRYVLSVGPYNAECGKAYGSRCRKDRFTNKAVSTPTSDTGKRCGRLVLTSSVNALGAHMAACWSKASMGDDGLMRESRRPYDSLEYVAESIGRLRLMFSLHCLAIRLMAPLSGYHYHHARVRLRMSCV